MLWAKKSTQIHCNHSHKILYRFSDCCIRPKDWQWCLHVTVLHQCIDTTNCFLSRWFEWQAGSSKPEMGNLLSRHNQHWGRESSSEPKTGQKAGFVWSDVLLYCKQNKVRLLNWCYYWLLKHKECTKIAVKSYDWMVLHSQVWQMST